MSRVKPSPCRQAGFTIMEVLMTMLVLTISLVGLTALQLQSIRQVTDTRRAGEALRLVKAVIEGYTLIDYARIPPPNAPNWMTQPKRGHENVATPSTDDLMIGVGVDGRSVGPFRVQYLVEPFQGGMMLTVQASWRSADAHGGNTTSDARFRTQRVTLTTVRFP
ncbi:MAG: prepilin-type N-terminal cleavage/methylation domain-containing protein [Proteobacteria bacterium]|nr:prepilin-type N-terminal cleavage/methylation domain-containing protein [Pseudomonadota bacterium]